MKKQPVSLESAGCSGITVWVYDAKHFCIQDLNICKLQHIIPFHTP